MAAHWNLNNSFRLNLDNGRPLENRKQCPEFSHRERFRHAPHLIPHRVAGSTAVGAAMIRAPKERPLSHQDFHGPSTYQTISNDYDSDTHTRVDRPVNTKKLFTRVDNIWGPNKRQSNFKSLQNITYKNWQVQDKERYHWTINGIKHTTHKQYREYPMITQYQHDHHSKDRSEPFKIVQDREGLRNKSYCLCVECGREHRKGSPCESTTYYTKYSYRKQCPIKRGICNPIDGMPATLAREEDVWYKREPTTMKDHYHQSPHQVEAMSGQPRIFSKKDKKKRADCHIGNMRKSMHFDTTYRDLYYTYSLPKLIS